MGISVTDPKNYGIVEFNNKKNSQYIEEKPPLILKNNFAVAGLYYYPNEVIKIAKKVKPSKRGELEISSINDHYLKNKKINVEILEIFSWLDTGSHDSLLEASNFIHTIEKHSGLKVACLEEIAFKMGYINKKQLKNL